MMKKWIYWAKLYESRFQANCLATRMQEDGWLLASEYPHNVEVYRSPRGRYGVRYTWQNK